jgi:hypothetical protein
MVPGGDTGGGAGIALGAGGRIHVVTSNVEEAWQVPPYSDASTYASTRGRATRWRGSMLFGGIAPGVAAHGDAVWATYVAYACGGSPYERGGIGVSRSPDGGRTWFGPVCLTRDLRLDSSWGALVGAGAGAVHVAGSPGKRQLGVWTSRDGGVTFQYAMLAERTRTRCCGDGGAAIAVAGRNAAIAWDAGGGRISVRRSDDAGRTWSRIRDLPLDTIVGGAGRHGRLVFWGRMAGTPTLVTWTSAHGWRSSPLPPETAAATITGVDGSAAPLIVAPGNNHGVGVLAPTGDCAYDDETEAITGTSLWITSQDDGRTWSTPATVTGCTWEGVLAIADDGRPYVLVESVESGYDLLVGPRPDTAD